MFFMLHCGKAMYNNLLWRNWSKQHLEKVYIIGNDFSSYEERYSFFFLKTMQSLGCFLIILWFYGFFILENINSVFILYRLPARVFLETGKYIKQVKIVLTHTQCSLCRVISHSTCPHMHTK